uniref:Down syndrome cell adhesion molecule-like protein Dscam2 n=1 Tax=Timema tahoe TaxID=61484 RepID=A0A7R9NWR2_9NEOP|nr:unnamed protein product [Timema tahoe]
MVFFPTVTSSGLLSALTQMDTPFVLRSGRELPDDLRQKVQSDGTLVITPVQKSTDAGVYTCSARNKQGHSARRSGEVAVIVPPKLSPFNSDRTQHVGERASLTCSVTKGDLPLTITWLKDGRALDPAQRISVSQVDQFNSILLIESLSPDHNGNYSCVARNLAAEATRTQQLTVNVPPIIEPFSFQDGLSEGMRTRTVCGVSRGDPPLAIAWLKDGGSLSPSLAVNVSTLDSYSSLLSISSLASIHSGDYTCVASNPAAEVRYTAKLQVKVPPRWIVEPTDANVERNRHVMLHCQAQGVPQPTITWKKATGLDITLLLLCVLLPIRTKSGHTIPMKPVRHRSLVGRAKKSVDHYRRHGVRLTPSLNESSHFNLEAVGLERVQSVVSNVMFCLFKRVQSVESNVMFYLFKRVQSVESNVMFYLFKRVHSVVSNVMFCLFRRVQSVVSNVMRVQSVESNVMSVCSGSKSGEYEELRERMYTKLLNNGSLLLQNVKEDREGFYLCQASNGIGSGIGKVVQVKVNLKQESTPDGVSAELQIAGAEASDSGSYFCKASNLYGADQQMVQLMVQEPPKSPTNVESVMISSRSVKIQWQHQLMDSNEVNKYIVQFRENDGSWQHQELLGTPLLVVHHVCTNNPCPPPLLSKGSWQHQELLGTPLQHTAALVEDLKPATRYVFRVLAEGPAGRSAPSVELAVKTDPQRPAGPPLNLSVRPVSSTELLVTWTPPLSELRHGDVQGYNIGYRETSSGSLSYNFTSVAGDGEEGGGELLLGGLHKFTRYTVVVQAFNQVGPGPLSEPSTAQTMEDVPSMPPEDVRCVGLTSQTIQVSWQPPPTSHCNGMLQGYKMHYEALLDDQWPGVDEGCKLSSVLCSMFHVPGVDEGDTRKTTALTALLTSLRKFTNYSVQVLAFTRVGDGVVTKPVVCTTEEDVRDRVQKPGTTQCARIHHVLQTGQSETVFRNQELPSVLEYTMSFKLDIPGAPAEIKVVVSSSQSLLVSWLPPNDPNGVLTKYNLYTRIVDGRDELNHAKRNLPSQHTSYESKGLQQHVEYQFWVTASTRVGEGHSSRVVAQVPTSRVAARISSFGGPVVRPWRGAVALPCLVVGIPAPRREWLRRDQPMRGGQVSETGELVLSGLQQSDSGNYTCQVDNNHGSDRIHHTLIVQVPPAAPVLYVTSATSSSILLHWKAGDSGAAPISGFLLNYRRTLGNLQELHLPRRTSSYELKTVRQDIPTCTDTVRQDIPTCTDTVRQDIPTCTDTVRQDIPTCTDTVKQDIPTCTDTVRQDIPTCTDTSLQCGSTYHLFLTARNKIGTSAASPTLSVRTQGQSPGLPQAASLLSPNSTSVILRLHVWPDNGCPLTYFVVQYRPIHTQHWTLVSNALKPQRRFTISSLTPASVYQIKVEANNIAGSSTAEFTFVTLTKDGDPPPPELMKRGHTAQAFYSDVRVIVPLVVAVLALLGAVAAAGFCWRNRQAQPHKETLDNQQNAEAQRERYYATIHKVALQAGNDKIPETSEDISPYATFQLAGSGVDPNNTLLHSFMYHEQAMTEGCASPPPAGASKHPSRRRSSRKTDVDTDESDSDPDQLTSSRTESSNQLDMGKLKHKDPPFFLFMEILSVVFSSFLADISEQLEDNLAQSSSCRWLVPSRASLRTLLPPLSIAETTFGIQQFESGETPDRPELSEAECDIDTLKKLKLGLRSSLWSRPNTNSHQSDYSIAV